MLYFDVRAWAARTAISLTALIACGTDAQPSGPSADAGTDAASDRSIGAAGSAGGSVDDGPSPDADASTSPTDEGARPDGARDAPGEESASDAGGPSLPPELADFCNHIAPKTCEYRDACGYGDTPPLATCETQELNGCLFTVSAVVPAIAAGRVAYDASKLDACINDSKATFCDSNRIGPGAASCKQVFRGLVPLGSSCYAPMFSGVGDSLMLNECDGGYCTASYQTCPGRCTKYAAATEACSNSGPYCADGLFCDGANCRPQLGLSAACDDVMRRCAPLLACGPHDADGAFTCETKKEEGQGCTYDTECYRFICLQGICRAGHEGESCAAFGKCDPGFKCAGRACVKPLAADAPCTTGYEACADGLACEIVGLDDAGSPVGACHPSRAGTDGQPCFNGQCGAGFWCDRSAGFRGTCKSPAGEGGTCEPSVVESCAAGLACNDAKVCQMPGGPGGPCSPDWTRTCADGLACKPDRTCAPRVGSGQPCTFSAACPPDQYCDVTCRPSKLPGTSCNDFERECLGGACDPMRHACNGICADPR